MIVDITPDNFTTELLEASEKKTVILYFHAQKLAECTEMGTLLEKAVGEDNPYITLGRVNAADPALQSLAIQLGLQTIPAVVSFKNKQPIDMRIGKLEKLEIAEYIAQYEPDECEVAITSAQKKREEGQVNEAYAILQAAHQTHLENYQLALHLAQVCLELKKLKQTEELLQKIPMADQNSLYHTLSAELELAMEATQSPELKLLEEKVAQEPDNLTYKQELAILYSQNGRKEEALDLLLTILKKDKNFDGAHKYYLDILATMVGDPAAVPYKRAVYSLLH